MSIKIHESCLEYSNVHCNTHTMAVFNIIIGEPAGHDNKTLNMPHINSADMALLQKIICNIIMCLRLKFRLRKYAIKCNI